MSMKPRRNPEGNPKEIPRQAERTSQAGSRRIPGGNVRGRQAARQGKIYRGRQPPWKKKHPAYNQHKSSPKACPNPQDRHPERPKSLQAQVKKNDIPGYSKEKTRKKLKSALFSWFSGFREGPSMRNSLFEFLFLLCLMDPPLLDYR